MKSAYRYGPTLAHSVTE